MLGQPIATDLRPAPPPVWEKLASGLPAELAWSDASETSDLAVFSWQGRDSMHARYYNPNIARFLSVDPGRDVDPKVPQAWNMYAYVRNTSVSATDPSGRYTCQGTSAQCQQIRLAVAEIPAAARALPKESPGRSLLNTISKFYGKPGQRNGVVISASPSPGGGVGGATTSNGTTTVFVDLRAEKTVAKDFSISLRAEIAATLTHEGQHGVDQRDFGMPRNRSDEFATEFRAYTVEGYAWQGQGVEAPSGIWTRTTGLSLDLVRTEAERSTAMWCAFGNCP